MCVMLFANSKIYAVLDLPAAVSYRHSLQLAFPPATSGDYLAIEKDMPREIAMRPRVMKRSAWLQLYFRRLPEESVLCQDQRRALAQEWGHNALEAIAHAWGRLLSFVGLRR
jgi:hypothetical protein